MSSSTSATPWLNYLNAIDGSSVVAGASLDSPTGAAAGSGANGMGFLSDDLRAQLEQWTTVSFDNSALNDFTAVFRDVDQQQASAAAAGASDAGSPDSKKDPSPYSKRPFGQFGHVGGSLERGFNAFAPVDASPAASDLGAAPASANNSFLESFVGLSGIGIGVDGSNTLFAAPGLVSSPVVAQQHQTPATLEPSAANGLSKTRSARSTESPAAPSPQSPATTSSRPSKKQRTASSASAASSESPAASPASGFKVQRQPLLTKAAILAAQAAELERKKALTPEEEAARQAELNRIAAEDDKRRRNTAASARFRIKKKQREHALEETVRELTAKLEKYEKELEAAKVENNFLRDLVIRKATSTGPAGGRISGGQEGSTGMGTAN